MIESTLIQMLGEDRFYADLVMRMRRVYTDKIHGRHLPTAAVTVEHGGTLYINPNFWANNPENRVQVLSHECLHLLFDHVGRSKETGGGPLFNVAADLAINELIRGWPRYLKDDTGKEFETCTVVGFKEKFPTMERERSFEYYSEFLRENVPSDGVGNSSDDHESWNTDDISPDEARARVRDLVERAAAATKYAGKEVPSALRPIIEQLFNTGLSWEQILRGVPEVAEVSYYESSRKRRNRRYGLDFPGERVVRRCKVVVGFDVSGSIGDEIVAKFANVLNEISLKADITVLFFDHAIQKEIEYTKGCLNGGIPGGGGTLFDPVFQRSRELSADALIMLTDGMMADSFDKPRFPVFWGILEGYKSPVDWGKVVVVK